MGKVLIILKQQKTKMLEDYTRLIVYFEKKRCTTHVYEDYKDEIGIFDFENLMSILDNSNEEKLIFVTDNVVLGITAYRLYNRYFEKFVYVHSEKQTSDSLAWCPLEMKDFVIKMANLDGIQQERFSSKLYININQTNYSEIMMPFHKMLSNLATLDSLFTSNNKTNTQYDIVKFYHFNNTENLQIGEHGKEVHIHLYDDGYDLKKELKIINNDQAKVVSYFSLYYIQGKTINDLVGLIQIIRGINDADENFNLFISAFLNVVDENTEYTLETRLQMLTRLLYVEGDHEIILNYIYTCILNKKIDITVSKSITCYLSYGYFSKRFVFSDAIYKVLKDVNLKLSNYIAKQINFKPGKRNSNKIVILIDQIVNVYHAPTQVLMTNVKKMLQETENEILIVSEDSFMFAEENRINGLTAIPNLTKKFVDEFSVLETDRSTVIFADDKLNIVDKYKFLANKVVGFQPDIVLSFANTSTLQNILYPHYPIVSVSMGSEYTPTNADFHLYKNAKRAKELNEAFNDGLGNSIYQYVYEGEFIPRTVVYTREELGFSDTDFLVITSGNRIETEIDHELIEHMADFMEKFKNVHWILVGSIVPSYLRKVFKEKGLFGRVKHSEYEDDLIAMNEICDISINPNRIGGGYSVTSCMTVGVPVFMTNFESDGLSFLGKENIYADDYRELFEVIEKVYHDPDLRNELGEKQKQTLASAGEKESFKELLGYLERAKDLKEGVSH